MKAISIFENEIRKVSKLFCLGHKSMVELLVKNGAEVRPVNKDGNTPLLSAVIHGDQKGGNSRYSMKSIRIK